MAPGSARRKAVGYEQPAGQKYVLSSGPAGADPAIEKPNVVHTTMRVQDKSSHLFRVVRLRPGEKPLSRTGSPGFTMDSNGTLAGLSGVKASYQSFWVITETYIKKFAT
jgi:hypothetical protein